MEKLELKHVAPYLPYGLKGFDYDKRTYLFRGIDENGKTHWESNEILDKKGYDIKPILRPLSDLFKLIYWDKNNEPYMIGYKYGIEKVKEEGIEFYASEYYAEYAESPKCYIDITVFDWWLFEKHFDIFGLIEKGLAIDINTIDV